MSYPNWPVDLKPDRIEWRLVGNVQRFTSALTGGTQSLALPGARWVATVTFGRRQGAAARRLLAQMALLTSAGRVWLPVFDRLTPYGTAAGAGVVEGAAQTGATLNTDGWTPSQTGVLLAGDYVQVGDGLHMITEDIDSDGAGAAALKLAPELRSSPADGATVITSAPRVLMELIDDQQSAWAVQAPAVYAISFGLREVFDV